jgi:hypothetical protein
MASASIHPDILTISRSSLVQSHGQIDKDKKAVRPVSDQNKVARCSNLFCSTVRSLTVAEGRSQYLCALPALGWRARR